MGSLYKNNPATIIRIILKFGMYMLAMSSRRVISLLESNLRCELQLQPHFWMGWGAHIKQDGSLPEWKSVID